MCPVFTEGIFCLYLPCGEHHCGVGSSAFAKKLRCKTKININRATLAVEICNSSPAACYTDTGCTYFHVTVLRHIRPMSTCSETQRSLSKAQSFLRRLALIRPRNSPPCSRKSNLDNYAQNTITGAYFEPAETDQHPHTRFRLTQCYSSINTQSTDVFKATLFTHFSSPCVYHMPGL